MRRSILKAAAAPAAAILIQAGLSARPAMAAPHGFQRLRETDAALPELSFTDAAGKAHGIADFAGRGLVINFWATWCPPCVAEMPALDRLAAMLAQEGIVILPLSSDRGGAVVVQAFYERTRVRHLGLWLDPRGSRATRPGTRRNSWPRSAGSPRPAPRRRPPAHDGSAQPGGRPCVASRRKAAARRIARDGVSPSMQDRAGQSTP